MKILFFTINIVPSITSLKRVPNLKLLNTFDMHVNDEYVSYITNIVGLDFYGLYHLKQSIQSNASKFHFYLSLMIDESTEPNYGTTLDNLLLLFEFERSNNYILCVIVSN